MAAKETRNPSVNATELERLRSENQSLKIEIEQLQKAFVAGQQAALSYHQNFLTTLNLIDVERGRAVERLRTQLAPYAKTIKTLGTVFAKGRSDGAQAQKQYAVETWAIVKTLNNDLLKHPDTARWPLRARAAHIEKILRERQRAQPNGNPYKASTIQKRIAGKG